jgi:hypothetical protein
VFTLKIQLLRRSLEITRSSFLLFWGKNTKTCLKIVLYFVFKNLNLPGWWW